jgi:hypothetical protein
MARKIEKIPTHQKFVKFCRRVSSNQVGIIRTMNKLKNAKKNGTNFYSKKFFFVRHCQNFGIFSYVNGF